MAWAGLTPKQKEANALLQTDATEFFLYGGARSGKTYLLTRAVIKRALRVKETTHAILRFRFNHLKASIINDTFPRVMKNEYPDLTFEFNKSDWFVRFPWNDSLIYYGGLDDKDRTEKILGQGHSTIYLNEISQISYASALKATTRLSQNAGLVLRAYYDANPPPQGHWSYKKFIKGIEPITGKPFPKSQLQHQAHMRLNPADNPHLPDETLRILEALPPKERKRFWEGEFLAAIDSALWTYEQVEGVHLPEDFKLPVFTRVVVCVDPSGCFGPEDKRSDEVGIVVVALGLDGRCYVLEDATDRLGPGGDEGWGAKAVKLWKQYGADAIIAEINYGGAMVVNTIAAVSKTVPVRVVTASRGKARRAEPVSTLYAKNMVYHVKPFPEMEEQMCNFSTAGYEGQRSPDRADAMIWGVTELLVGVMPGEGLMEYYEMLAKAAKEPLVVPPLDRGFTFPHHTAEADLITDTETLVTLMRPKNGPSVVYGMNGQKYVVGSDDLVRVYPDDVVPLLRGGFIRQEGA